VWYRAPHETEWHTGLSKSVSETGAVIRADEPDTPPEDLIVAIGLPSDSACLVGRGRVLRFLNTDDKTAAITFAVQVSGYRIDQCDTVLRLV